MMPASKGDGLLLSGLDGSNPLAFLAAIGTLRVLADTARVRVKLGWSYTPDGWRPLLSGGVSNRDQLSCLLATLMEESSDSVFDSGKVASGTSESNKFPFKADIFAEALRAAVDQSGLFDRREADFLAGFGTEVHPDKKTGGFQCTRLKMVRTGDSNGQGMLFYAKAIRKATSRQDIHKALFHDWDYGDKDYSLRWDPIEDQRYALRWSDPSKKKSLDGPATMRAANSLAIEALRCLPTVPVDSRPRTTGFDEKVKPASFIWPIWTSIVGIEIVRSLLSLRELCQTPLQRGKLFAMGVEEVYGAPLVRPNQYYRNFAPARPVP